MTYESNVDYIHHIKCSIYLKSSFSTSMHHALCDIIFTHFYLNCLAESVIYHPVMEYTLKL